MKWILIILLNTQPTTAPTSLAVEFETREACETAAAETVERIKGLTKGSKRAVFCVPKGEASSAE